MKNNLTPLERAEYEQFIKNHVSHILKCGNLSHYYLRHLTAVKMKNSFTIVPDPQYLEFTLRYDIGYVRGEIHSGEYEDIIRTLCHEVTHIVSAEIEVIPKLKKSSDVFDPMFERFTEHASRWLYRLYTSYMTANGIDPSTGLAKKKTK